MFALKDVMTRAIPWLLGGWVLLGVMVASSAFAASPYPVGQEEQPMNLGEGGKESASQPKRKGRSRTSQSKQSPGKAASKKKEDEDALGLSTMVVTGSRRARKLKDTVTQTEVITRKQLQATSAQRLSEVLETHLGIQITHPAGAGTGLQIQGLNSKHILLLLDGQRINGRVRGVLDLDRVPIESIERIEIIKGATSALYGADAMGGVINIVTRKPREPFFANLSGRYGYGDSHLGDISGTVGLRYRGWSGLLSLSWAKYESWDRDTSTPSTTGSNDHQLQVDGKVSYEFSKKVSLRLQSNYQYRDRAGVDSNSVGAIYDRTNRTESSTTGLFLDARLAPLMRLRWRANASYFRDQFLYEQRRGASPGEVQDTQDVLLENVLQFDVGLGSSHILSVGVDALYERIQTPRVQGGASERGRVALFAQYEWMLSKPIRVSLVPGVRISYDTQFQWAFNPKLSVRVDPIPKLALRASYGFGFRAPDFKDLYLQFENGAAGYVVKGNPELKPEYGRSLQVGVEWSGLSWMVGRANFYRNDLNNLINTQSLSGQPGETLQITYTNIDAAVTQGVEAQLVFSYQRYFQCALGYTYLWSEDASTRKPLFGRPAHRGTFQLIGRVPQVGLRLMVRGAIVGPRDNEADTNADGELERIPLEPYVLFHARLSYHFWRRQMSVFVSVQNILNAGDPTFLPIRPRTFFAGLRYQYR
ncbi:MAG: TonB-dependent receptor [Deltaproteobacteria bacterium]|nr:MAG: TonB-dependent receptor [Deltaproteobacteria bacterium]